MAYERWMKFKDFGIREYRPMVPRYKKNPTEGEYAKEFSRTYKCSAEIVPIEVVPDRVIAEALKEYTFLVRTLGELLDMCEMERERRFGKC